jgi:hypothetical protein
MCCLAAALKLDATHVPAMVNLAALLSRSTEAAAARTADRLWTRALVLLRDHWRHAEHGRQALEAAIKSGASAHSSKNSSKKGAELLELQLVAQQQQQQQWQQQQQQLVARERVLKQVTVWCLEGIYI